MEKTDERWTLRVVLDEQETQTRANPSSVFPNDEMSRIIAWVRESWGLLPEELTETVWWSDTVLYVGSDVLDPLTGLIGWVLTHTVPVKVSLFRNEGRL